MIVISDGNFAENQHKNNLPFELGYDFWTNSFYSNKKFLINSIHHLMGNTDLLNPEHKEKSSLFIKKKKVNSIKSVLTLIFFLLITFYFLGKKLNL